LRKSPCQLTESPCVKYENPHRPHLQANLSFNEVGRILKISKSVVGKYLSLARVAGVDWSVAQTLSDQELEAKLYKAALPRNSKL
jgi:hypothetical protein